MAAGATCPRCGAVNQPGFIFCANCGSPLPAGVAGPAAVPPAYAPMGPPAYGAPMGYPGLPSPMAAEQRKQIDRTRTGLLLLLIGTLIGWVPIIGLIGGLLVLIGAVLVILGRKAFGSTHRRNVVLAIVLVLVGIIGGAILGAAFAFALIAGGVSQNPQDFANAFTSAINNLLIGAIVLVAISGLASVLFTYALQQQMGKILLWAGYGANIALQIVIFAIIRPLITGAVNDAISGGTVDTAPLLALQGQLAGLGLLGAIPSLLFAAATYLAWSRVNRGEIPPPTTPPGMPAPSPAPWPPASPPPPSGPAPPTNPP